MIKWDLSQGCKDSSIYANQCDTPYEQIEEEKPYDHFNRCRKSFWQNSTPIYDKNSPESGHRGNLPQYNIGHIWQTHSKHHSFFFFFWNSFIYLFIYLWLCWVFISVRGLSVVAASGGHSSSRCAGLSLSPASLVVEHRLQTRRLSSCGSRA